MNEVLKLLVACRSSVQLNRDRFLQTAISGSTETVQNFAAAEARRLDVLLARIDALVRRTEPAAERRHDELA